MPSPIRGILLALFGVAGIALLLVFGPDSMPVYDVLFADKVWFLEKLEEFAHSRTYQLIEWNLFLVFAGLMILAGVGFARESFLENAKALRDARTDEVLPGAVDAGGPGVARTPPTVQAPLPPASAPQVGTGSSQLPIARPTVMARARAWAKLNETLIKVWSVILGATLTTANLLTLLLRD